MVATLKMPRLVQESSPQSAEQYPRMRLVPADDSQGGAERRMFPRKEVQMEAQGRRLDHSLSARRSPMLSLSVRDLSLGGISAISDMPIARGERVSLMFPTQGMQRGWDALGRIIRCDISPMGYRVAVEFDPMPKAA